MTFALYIMPDPAAGTGITAIQLFDNTPGADTEGVNLWTSEDQTDTATITEHPVELGANVSDNVRPSPAEVSYAFSVATTPQRVGSRGDLTTQALVVPVPPLNVLSISALAGAAVGALTDALFPSPPPMITGPTWPDDYDPAAEMQEMLRIVKDAGALCDVLTSTGTLSSMVISSVKMTRKEPGFVDFVVELKQVFTVSSSTVDAPSALEPRGAPAKSAGAQAPTAAGASDAKKATALLGAAQGVGGLF